MQVNLSAKDSERLQSLARHTGKSEQELLVEAIGQLFDKTVNTDRLDRLRQARGIWQRRVDVEPRQLRDEWNRS